MKIRRLPSVLGLSLGLAHFATAHDIGGDPHPQYDRSVRPPEILLAQNAPQNRATVGQRAVRTNRPAQAAPFEAFAPKVSVRWDEKFLFVESNGLPAHKMMVGITAWQQQVPLPQNYTGANAWQIPLVPVPAKEVISIKNRFLRGAIALAVNGIPIFNPQNNRGEVSQEIGELDEWGGHCGRADDYHYHSAPLHLQAIAGKGQPIAFALDGYAIYGLTEPDGSQPAGLDAFNGHTTNAPGYHYHASNKYPYVNGGFHGEVTERDQQVDPQPRAQPVRQDQPPLRGAKITGFTTSPDGKQRSLIFTVGAKQGAVNYTDNGDGAWKFTFVSADGSKQEENYTRREGGGGGGRGGPRPDGERPPRRPGEGPGAGGDRPPRPDGGPGGPRPNGERPPQDGGNPPRDGGNPPRDGGQRPPAREGGGDPNRRGAQQETASQSGPDAMKKPSATFSLTSTEVKDGGALPMDFTGDGSGATLPLAWKGAPAGTKSYALLMDHLAPGNVMKHYWTMWDIPATTTSLPKNVKGVGKIGTSFKGQLGYEPPHSQGPGAKTYVLTVYALSAPLQITQQPREVNRDVLLAAMKDKVLASSSLSVVYTRSGAAGEGPRPPRRAEATGDGEIPNTTNRIPPATIFPRQLPDLPPVRVQLPQRSGDSIQPQQLAAADQLPPHPRPGQPGEHHPGGKGGPDNKGLIKPGIADTMKLNVYADNWFILYVNGRLVAVDPIQFTPHNVVSVDFLPEYPMTIAVMAKDNADPKTGLEYGDHIGDGGFILKFGDGTATNAKWKAKNFFKGPANRDVQKPTVEHTPIPEGWWKTDFDDSKWANATEYTEERVNPKQPYFEADFKGAKFIWTEDLDLDNTIIFRTKIEKPGWKQRWNTKPDLDVSGAPFK